AGSQWENRWPLTEKRRPPVATSHNLTQPSPGLPTVLRLPPPTARVLPSGLNATALTIPGSFGSTPLREGLAFPVDRSHSLSPGASVLPPGLNAPGPWPGKEPFAFQVAPSHSRTVPFLPAVASSLPSGLKATVTMPLRSGPPPPKG